MRDVTARVYGHEPASLEADVATYSRSQRMRRALRTAAPWLLGALVSLPIPGWHFVGVPGCLVAAFVLGLRKLREPSSLLALRGACPACGGAQSLDAPVALPGEITLSCPGCREFIRLEGPALL